MTLLCATKVLCEDVLYWELLSEEVELVCERRLCSLWEAVDRWYQSRSSSDTAVLPEPFSWPSLPRDGVLMIWEREGVSRTESASSPCQFSLNIPPLCRSWRF